MQRSAGNFDWQPGTGRRALAERARLLARIRGFFAARGVTEVETPVLSRAGNSDPAVAQWQTSDPLCWLRTSPEYAMKRLLADGSGDIYELGRVFRHGERGRHHNTEFTLLEWYRVGWSYHRLMDELRDLVRHCCPDAVEDEQRAAYRDLFQAHTGVDPFLAGPSELAACAARHGIEAERLERDQWLDLLLSHLVQPALPANTLTFVYDFPASQAALARVRPGTPPVAERFELFLGPLELANGYQELVDPVEQRRRFEQENRVRESRGGLPVPVDTRLIAALEAGLPECSGVALGVDRLLMHITGAESLDGVIPFPSDRA